jgi:crossover junction endodeoxyribonuclease RuvC
VICLAARQRDVTVMALAPAEVKRTIAAHGQASKAQIQLGVQRLLGLPVLPRPSHIADALALALTGLSRLGSRLG